MTRRALAASAAVTALALALTGCVAKSDLAQSIPVDITDDGCAVAAATAPAGAVTFSLENTGSDVNEFEILADDQLRIVGEKENVTPGQEVEFVAQLAPGTYYTACKFQQVGAPVGLAEFTVTGEASAVSADEQALADQAVTEYLAYVRSQAAELLPPCRRSPPPTPRATTRRPARCSPRPACPTSASSRRPRRSATSTRRSTSARSTPWPTASTGPASTASRRTSGRRPPATSTPTARTRSSTGRRRRPSSARRSPTALVADVTELHDLVTADDFAVSLDAISNGAIALLDEVAAGKITGEEDWWSGTDLSDFAANVQGAGVAFGAVRALAESKGDDGEALAAEIDEQFAALEAALAAYGSLDVGLRRLRRAHRRRQEDALRPGQRPRRAALAADRTRCSASTEPDA